MRYLNLWLLGNVNCEVAIDVWIGILTTWETLSYRSVGNIWALHLIFLLVWVMISLHSNQEDNMMVLLYVYEQYFTFWLLITIIVCRKWHHWKRSWMNLVLFWPRWLQIVFLHSPIFIFLCLCISCLIFISICFLWWNYNHW